MRIEMSPGIITNTVNGVTQVLPSRQDDFIFNNWEEGKNETSIGMRGGKNFTFSPKGGPSDTVYKVVEYDHDQMVKEWEIDVSKVDAYNATCVEMWALSIYTDDHGITKDFRFRIDSAFSSVYGTENKSAYMEAETNFYEALKTLMEADKREGFYQHYLSVKSFFDYYDKKEKGVPSRLL